MYLTERYPDCFVEYRAIIVNGHAQGIEIVGDRGVSRMLGEIEKKVDIQRARKAGCKTMEQVCKFLNGVERWKT